MCCKCSGKTVSPAIASFKEVSFGNDSFHVESTFKYLGDTIGQDGDCSDAVSTCIFPCGKHSENCYLFSPIQTKLRGMPLTCV